MSNHFIYRSLHLFFTLVLYFSLMLWSSLALHLLVKYTFGGSDGLYRTVIAWFGDEDVISRDNGTKEKGESTSKRKANEIDRWMEYVHRAYDCFFYFLCVLAVTTYLSFKGRTIFRRKMNSIEKKENQLPT